MVIAYGALFAHALSVILRKQGQPYSVYLLIVSTCLFCAAILGVVIEYVHFFGFYSLFVDILQECLINIFIYAALFYAFKFALAITRGDWRKIKPALFFLLLTYAFLFPSYILYKVKNEWFFLVYFLARVAFWVYYFSLIILHFHQYANKLTDDVLLKSRLRLIEVGCVVSMFFPFLAVFDVTWSLSFVAAVIAAIPYYIGYKSPKWLERKIAFTRSKEEMLDKFLLLLGILSEHYTNATRSSKSLLADYVKAFGTFLRLSNGDVDVLVKASYFLDVGSMQLRGESRTASFQGSSIPLHRPKGEHKHPIVSADFAKMLLETERLGDIILHHHDRWDGQGRFNQARGEEIPFGSRIIAIADCFVRAKVHGKDEVLALDEVKEQSGTLFDPSLVEKFSEFLSLKREEE